MEGGEAALAVSGDAERAEFRNAKTAEGAKAAGKSLCDLGETIKSMHPGIPLITGGPLPTTFPLPSCPVSS